jgi:hypothetical protein
LTSVLEGSCALNAELRALEIFRRAILAAHRLTTRPSD